MKNSLWFGAGAVCGALAAVAVMRPSVTCDVSGFPEVRYDTILRRDTLTVSVPVVVERRPALRCDTVVLPLASAGGDSAAVTVPVDTAVYSGEQYRAVVSGFGARLDSLTLFPQRSEVRVRIPLRESRPGRWNVNLSAGVALTPRGVEPAVTLGVGYTLFRF